MATEFSSIDPTAIYDSLIILIYEFRTVGTTTHPFAFVKPAQRDEEACLTMTLNVYRYIRQ